MLDGINVPEQQGRHRVDGTPGRSFTRGETREGLSGSLSFTKDEGSTLHGSPGQSRDSEKENRLCMFIPQLVR